MIVNRRHEFESVESAESAFYEIALRGRGLPQPTEPISTVTERDDFYIALWAGILLLACL